MTRGLLLLAIVVLSPATPSARPESPPEAEARPVIDTYWGVDIQDDYQYMEDVTDPEVVRWLEDQNGYTRERLDAYPDREALAQRVKSLTHHRSPDYYSLAYSAGRIFAIKRQPPEEQPLLVLLQSLTDVAKEKVLVDPNVLDPTKSTAIDFYVPSHDGKFVAVSLSKHGTEDGALYVYEVETGLPLQDEIPRVNGGTAGGSVAWTAANDGFYYTRYPYPGERPDGDLPFYQKIWFHKLGTDITSDTYVLGETFPRIAEIEMETSDDGRYIVAEVSNGDGGEYEYWLLRPRDAWIKFAEFSDWVQRVRFGADGSLYLLSRRDSPRKRILRISAENPDLSTAETVVAPSEAVITDFVAAKSRIYVSQMLGGPSWLSVYDLHGRSLGQVRMGEISTVDGMVRLDADRILLRRQSYTMPPAWYEHSPGLESPVVTPLARTSAADFSDCEVRRVFATADDGTEIPIDLIMRKGTPQDGTAPLLLHGYGSYGISQRPDFTDTRLIWIEQGGIYAVACIRGGGEYGDEWHRAANLERKKVSMDDFAACARFLVEEGYTSRDHIAIEGGSAGGLLVYGTMAHYPDHIAAVVSKVGISDALRTELSPNGEYNITEFGTVKNETQFHGMYAASPYHHIRDDVQYPAVLSMTGMNDPRVEPWQTFKMTARLQATQSTRPVLMRVSMKTGHGRGTSLSERDAQLVDMYSFLFWQLGVDYATTQSMRAD